MNVTRRLSSQRVPVLAAYTILTWWYHKRGLVVAKLPCWCLESAEDVVMLNVLLAGQEGKREKTRAKRRGQKR